MGTPCVCVCVGIFYPRRENGSNNVALDHPRPVRHESFHRAPPTAPAPASVASLVSELNDPSPNVRERAAVELGHAGTDAFDAVADLKRLAATDPDEEVRRASRPALYNVRGSQPSPWGFFSPTPLP
jgi:hypothetical protein